MSWLPALVPALATALACAVLGLLVPVWLARLPEPEPAPQPASEPEPAPLPDPLEDESDPSPRGGLGPPPPKEPYAVIAALPWLRPVAVLAGAVVGGAIGAAVGWGGALLYLVPLVPVGVLLFVVDARTTLLPTRVLHPTYAALAVLVPLAALVDGDLSALVRAAWGWLLVGGWFWVCWRLLGAWGFGDVRLARVLGPALGYLGWAELVGGLLLMLVVGALGGVLLALVRRSLRRRFPYGPFMLLGALGAVLWATPAARAMGYPVG